MKGFSFRILFFVGFCFLFSVVTIFAQKNKQDTEVESKPVESKPIETKSESPPPSPPKTESDNSSKSEPSPTYQPSTTSSDTSSSDSGTTPSPNTAGRNDDQQRNRREGQKREIERQRREAEERRRREEKERRKREKNNCPYYDAYGNCQNYPPDQDPSMYPNSTVNPSAYFGNNDVSYLDYESFVDSNIDNYQPYFENPLRPEFTPFMRVSLIETSRDLPFYLTGWVFYYEPDLDNFFIDFAKFGQFKYDVLVLTPVGKTIKKVNKKFDYKGNAIRLVLVEEISLLSSDSIYSFNLSNLPKGDYELKLINKDGKTVKRQIKLK